jgi:hypothetical protein
VLQPVLAMFFLTFTVWLVMYIQRFRYMAANKIKPQRIATPEAVATLLPEWVNRPSDNLKNLFEMPVLFYALCGILISMQTNDETLIIMAWVYVGLRAVHSLVHCTINIVSLRFIAYLLSSLTLFGMGVRLALSAS